MILWNRPAETPEIVVPELPTPEPTTPEVEPVVSGDAFIEFGDIMLTHEMHTVIMTHTFVNPVVIMGTLSYNGQHPSTVRVMNV